MKILKRETIWEGKYLRVKKKYFETRDGKKGIWECLERKTLKPTGVVIFGLTKKKELILEKIYRPPLESWVIELPAGLCDRERESEIETAKRELLEETGYLAKKLIPVFKFPICSGISNEEAICYFASDLKLSQKPSAEDSEEIEILKIPLNKLENFIFNLPKEIKIDIKILGIFFFLKKKKLI